MNAPMWDDLNRFGRNRLLQSSYIWLVVVPVAVKVLSAVADPLILSGISEGLRLHLTLPFSWQLFYLSAVAVSIAGAIYTFFCPELVRKFSTFSDFRSEGRGLEYLRAYAKRRSVKPEDFDGSWNASILEGEIDEAEKASAMGRPNTPDPTGRLAQLFWQMHAEENAKGTSLRIACAVFYGVGLALIAVVFVENLVFVVRTWFGSAP